jgi:uncharacterized repeat protein (TIGR01451 family)
MYPTAEARSRRVTRARWLRAAVAAALLAAQFVVYTQVVNPGAASAGAPIAQTYYTPFEAQEFIDILRSIHGTPTCCSGSVVSTVSITSGRDSNTIYYDHFEDGYETDPTTPAQASTVTINLNAGSVWTQDSTILIDQGPGSNEREAGFFFDGRDKIVAMAPIAVTQAAYATTPGTLHAGAVQVLDLDKSGTRFDVPAGQNANLNEAFDYVGLVLVASRNFTTVDIDADADGSFETTVVLDEGETYVVDGGVMLGAAVESTKAISAYITSGDIGASYEGRMLELYPTSVWANDMVSPVGAYSDNDGTRVFLFNPNPGAITVDVTDGAGGTASIPIASGAQATHLMPIGQGARFTSQGGEDFYGFQMITTEGTSTSSFDWGFTLVPMTAATPSVIVPLGYGAGDISPVDGTPDNSYSPVWVASNMDARIYIDRDGNPATGSLTDPLSNQYDFHCDVTAYGSLTLYDDGTTNCYDPTQNADQDGGDRDMTGARIYTLDTGARLSAAWGQRPRYTAGSPALDMGTTILPFPEIVLIKSSYLAVDGDGDGYAGTGDVVRYTMTMENLGFIDVHDVLLTDEDPDNTSYVANSTTLDGVAQPDDSTPYSPSPLDADSPQAGLYVGTMNPGQVITAVFDVTVDGPAPIGESEIINYAVMTANVGRTSATDTIPYDVPPLQIDKTSAPDSSPTGSGETISYTVRVYNTSTTTQTGVTVTDTLPPGVTYVPASVAADIDGVPITAGDPPNLVSGATMPSESWMTITFDVTVDTPIAAGTTEFTNTAQVVSVENPTPVSADVVDPADPLADLSLIKTDDETAPLSPGDRLVYTIQVTNAGPDEADDVVVVDTLPSGVTFVPAASDPSCVEGPAGTITCSLGDMGVTSTSFDIAVDIDAGVDGTITNTATVSSSTPEGYPGDETDTEDTAIDSPPVIAVTKTAVPTSVTEPGGTVAFSVSVENTSVEPVTVTSLTDDVFGDLLDGANPNVTSNDCPTQPTSLGVGATLNCSFDASVAGGFGDAAHVDTVTATADDDEANTATDSDQATVSFDDAVPTMTVTKTAVPTSVAEPGGTVTFSLSVENTSPEPVTLTALSDDVFGDLLSGSNPNVSNNTCPAQSTSLGIGATFSCSFDGYVAGFVGDSAHVDTVTATIADDDGNAVDGADQASVTFTDTPPSVSVTKTPSPASVPQPGGTVTFSVLVQNTSVEPVTVTSLTDDIFGNLLDGANPNVTNNDCPAQSTSLGTGASLSCSFDAFIGTWTHTDTVTAVVADDEGGTASDSDSATVTMTDVLPSVDVSKNPTPGSVQEPGGTVTFDIVISNTSVETVWITALTDDVFGDLFDGANPNISANTCVPLDGSSIGSSGQASCSFDAILSGFAGDPDHVDTVTVTVQDGQGNDASDFDSATVPFGDEIPSISVTKTPSTGSVSEPGATVTFSVSVENTSVEPLTLTSLTDSVFGDLLDAGNPNVSNNTCPAQSTSLGVGATLSCSFDAFVGGDAGDPDHLDTVTAAAADATGNTATGFDSATVSFLDVLPSVGVTKTPSVASVDEPGEIVTYSILVTNASVETVTVTSLNDDVFGDLLDAGNASISSNSCLALPSTIAASGFFACSFQAFVAGDYGEAAHVNTVTFTATDDEGNPASDADSATVAFDDVIPAATLFKAPSSGTVEEPGGPITFTVQIVNAVSETLTVDSLNDDVFGDLLDPGNANVSSNTCVSLATVAGNASANCSFTAAVSGVFGDPDHVDTVTATLSDDDGNSVTPSDDATVAFALANSSVSGFVFEDLDHDGVFNGSEVPLAGVDIVVTDSGGGSSTVTSAADGTWSAPVLPGPVTIDVDDATVPAGYSLTTANDTQVVNALSQTDVPAEDIGYGPPIGSISGVVFLDLDRNQYSDPYEPGFESIMVELFDDLGAPVASTSTAADGSYSFGGLAPGDYTIVVDGAAVGAGYVGSVDPDGTIDDETDEYVLPAEDVENIDFGYRGTGSLGDTVWVDEDGDGVIDPDEPVLPGALLTLIWAGPDDVLDTADDYEYQDQTSDGDGGYLFEHLPPGLFRISVDAFDVAVDVTATTDTEIELLLAAGEAYELADFGFQADELPLTGLDAEHLMLAAALMLGLGGLVLADGRKRERHFDIALERIDD